jgi:anion-transporting  ArsA/GET3 family ATPase
MELARLTFVTGKGGTGKSTVAAALTLAAGSSRPILADLDGRMAAASILRQGRSHLNQTRRQIETIAINGRNELEAFVNRFVPVKAIARRMLHSRTFGYVSASAPGIEAFLMMERLRQLAGEAALNDRYAVADAPSSGGAVELLKVAASVRDMAPWGTLNRLACGVEGLLADPHRFGVLIVVTPEQPAVREALEIAERIRAVGVARLGAVLNRAVDDLFDERDLARLGDLPRHAELVRRRRAMAARTEKARRALNAAGFEFIELPMVFRPALGLREIESLVRVLKQGVIRQ